MSLTTQSSARLPRPSTLVDVAELLLDQGIVIDAWARVSLTGVELAIVDARVVLASVDTYLRFAQVVQRLDLQPGRLAAGLPGLAGEISDDGRHGSRGEFDDERPRRTDGSSRQREPRRQEKEES